MSEQDNLLNTFQDSQVLTSYLTQEQIPNPLNNYLSKNNTTDLPSKHYLD